MPRLQQLRYLVALADTLSFSRAAEACHVTQPTLSAQLKELEDRLGTTLAERTRARVILTPIGAEIAKRARAVLAEVDDIREIARRDDPEALQATLQLGVAPTVGAYVLSPAMQAIRQAFPHLRLFLREGRLEDLPRRLQEGVHDVLLLPQDPGDPDCASAHLMREPLHLVLPAEHRLASHQTIDPRDLAGEIILAMESSPQLHDQISGLCREAGARLARDYEGTTLDTLRLMVAAGMGITLLPALYVQSDVLREKQIVARPLSTAAPSREITMVWRKTSPRQHTYAMLAETIATSLAPWNSTGPG